MNSCLPPRLQLDPRVEERRISCLLLRRSSRNSWSPSKMKVIAAYLLAVLGGNLSPSAGDLKDIFESVRADADNDRIEFLLSEVKGRDITELIIALGREKFASVPCDGGAVAVAAPAGAGGGATAASAAAEPKKEEKDESDEDMGFSLFD